MTKWRRAFSFRVIWRARIITEELQSHPPLHRRIAGWMANHKLYTALLLLLALVVAEAATIPWFSVASLKTQNPGETALMRQRSAEELAAGRQYRITQKWVPLSRLPKHVADAVVVAEDGTFFTHGGVDWFEVRESLEKDIKERRAARGGSTITQQVAKNLYLSTSKDPVRKLKELVITLLLERELTKERILEIYLNIAEWGEGVYGIEAAAETYFGRRAEDLTLDQAARLAAVIPSPLKHRPDAEGKYVTRRSLIVLGRMGARNMIRAAASDSGAFPAAARDTTAVTGAPMGEDTTEVDEGGPDGL